MNNITGNMNNRCGSPHIAYQQFSCPVTGNIRISNKKQSYNMNTITWNNNTCNTNEDPYDKNKETIHACVTVIC